MTPFLISLGVMLFLYFFFYFIWSKEWNPLSLVVGQDKRPSSSKFQFLLWTVVVIFSYVAVHAARALMGYYPVIDEIPRNLLVVMGLSVITTAAAKGITVGFLETGRIAKPDPPSTQPNPNNPRVSMAGTPVKSHSGWGAIFTDDDGFPDLSKIQMIAWTFIAIGIYLIGLVALVNALPHALDGVVDKDAAGALVPVTWQNLTSTFLDKTPEVAKKISIPDISPALMVLMGLGQGAFLGKKLVTANTARLTQLSPTAAKAGSEVIISGVSLSEAPDGNQVTLDGKPTEPPAVVVNSSQIKFTFPQLQPGGAPWKPGEVVTVGLISGGQPSANTLPFTVLTPLLKRLSGTEAPAKSQLTLFGQGFGATQGASRVLIDGKPFAATIPASDWKDTEIKITLPATVTAGAHQVSVEVDGQPQTDELPFTVT